MIRLLKKPLVKRAFYGSLQMSGALRLVRRIHRGKSLILTYHGVLQKSTNSFVNRICIDSRVFEEQMRWLKRNYTVLPLSVLIDGLEGKVGLPPFAVAITFDDGFRNNFSAAFPILKSLEIPATVFLATAHIGAKDKYLWTDHVDSLILQAAGGSMQVRVNGHSLNYEVSTLAGKEMASENIRAYLKTLNPEERNKRIKSLEGQVRASPEPERIREADGFPSSSGPDERYAFLDWDEVRAMAQHGIEFGSHTHSHAILSTLSEVELERELVESKRAIETELSRSCDLFSYPNGTSADFGVRDQRVLAELGFRAAASQIRGFNLPGGNLFALKRINIPRSNDLSYFKAVLAGIAGRAKK
jgi:peptidoglycan/xylan/chitin deacetylase (PgdA/CDA1 family)